MTRSDSLAVNTKEGAIERKGEAYIDLSEVYGREKKMEGGVYEYTLTWGCWSQRGIEKKARIPEVDGCEQKVELACAYLRLVESERNWKGRVPKVL